MKRLVLAGCALLLSKHVPRASVALSLALMLLGGIGLLEFATGQDAVVWRWLDGLLPDWPRRPAGSMTEFAALAFTMIGVA